MPISCHFQDCEALLFVLTTCKQRYIKYPGFTFTFISETIRDKGLAWFQRTTNRKWPMGNRMVT